jgi:cell division protein FtsZ
VLFSIAGGEDLGMLEVQDAANVITEAIDPDAKVIFGAVTDNTLKKGAVRVTVIATGFPETPARTASGFVPTPAQRVTVGGNRAKDLDVPPATVRPVVEERKPEPKKIIDAGVIGEKFEKKIIPEPPKQHEEPKLDVEETDDDDAWGGLPSFLRRK